VLVVDGGGLDGKVDEFDEETERLEEVNLNFEPNSFDRYGSHEARRAFRIETTKEKRT
jgi:hypothetical protein